MNRVWTEEKNELLKRLYPTGHLGSLAARLGVSYKALKARAKVMGVKRKVNVHHPWTDRQLKYLCRHYAKMSAAEIALKVKHSESSVYQKAKVLRLEKHPDFLRERGSRNSQHPNAVAHRFVKGQEPPNKGKRIEEFMSKEGIKASSRTRFKKGQKPRNTSPIGHERVSKKDGYVFIKVSDGKPMVLKHRYVWEQHYGAVPDGWCVAFRDGNRQNCDIDNLYLLSRKEMARRRVLEETPEGRKARVAKAQITRNKLIRRDKIRIHWGMEPLTKLVKRW
jgi:hypothetical protein